MLVICNLKKNVHPWAFQKKLPAISHARQNKLLATGITSYYTRCCMSYFMRTDINKLITIIIIIKSSRHLCVILMGDILVGT